MLANSRLRRENANFQDISYENIQDRRATTSVPCGAGGVLHDYVPFYFAPRAPMLYAIHKKFTRYQGGQEAILHFVTMAEAIAEVDLAFAFTDGHAVMAYAGFYEDLTELERVIDWQVMKSRYWADTDDDPNRKCKRQAEFLVYDAFPWDLIQEIGVVNQSVQVQVRQILQRVNDFTPVNVYPNWYY
jgi:hypothetical protein